MSDGLFPDGTSSGYLRPLAETKAASPSEEEHIPSVDEVEDPEQDDIEQDEEDVDAFEPEQDEPKPAKPKLDEYGFPVVPKELEGFKKDIVGKFLDTKKEAAQLRIRAQMVDFIEQNPQAAIDYIAKQYGISLPGATQEKEGNDFDFASIQPGENESIADFTKRLMAAGFKQMQSQSRQQSAGPARQPAAQHAPDTTQALVAYLNDVHPDWKTYELPLVDFVKKYPAFTQSPQALSEAYEIVKAKALGASAKKVAERTKRTANRRSVSSVSRGSSPAAISAKGKVLSFDQAWQAAAKQLKLGGKTK